MMPMKERQQDILGAGIRSSDMHLHPSLSPHTASYPALPCIVPLQIHEFMHPVCRVLLWIDRDSHCRPHRADTVCDR